MPHGLPDDFRPLSEQELREAVSGRPSLLEQQRAAVGAALEQIGDRRCPTCAGGLVPRTSTNPLEVFTGATMNWRGWCPVCKVTA